MDKLESIDDFVNAINLVTSKIQKDGGINIVYSITFHEQAICMLDQILALLTYNHLYNIIIICSINENIKKEISKVQLPKNIIIHPDIRPTSMSMLWNTNLFNAHMKNFEYVQDIDFKYYCTMASNEMLIKNINLEDINKRIILEKKEFIPQRVDKILDKFNTWTHYKPFMENINICSFFLINKLEPFALQHEGLILPKHILEEVLVLYKKNDFDLITLNTQNVLLEEVFIPTYLHNHYNFNDYVLTLRDFDAESIKLNEILKTDLYSVKRVPRNRDNIIRCFIRTRYLAYLEYILDITL